MECFVVQHSFSMFYSAPPYHDLIFQDATRQLKIIEPSKRRYDLYLGGDFMRAKRITDCHSGASRSMTSVWLSSLVFFCSSLMHVLCY